MYPRPVLCACRLRLPCQFEVPGREFIKGDAGGCGCPELSLCLAGSLERQAMLADLERAADPLPADADIKPLEGAVLLDYQKAF